MPGGYYLVTMQEFFTWPPANYDDPVERRWLGPYTIVLLVLSTCCTAGRLYLRSRRGHLPWDDWLIFVAWIFALAFTVSACMAQYHFDLGRHSWDIPVKIWPPGLSNGWLAQVLFAQSTCAIKVAILGFYWRLFDGTTRRRWLAAVYTLLFITIGTWIAFTISYLTYCVPLSDSWNWPLIELAHPLDATFHCIDSSGLIIAIGVLTIASDFWCAALPCLYFRYNGLSGATTRRQTIAMNIIFCNGFFVTGIGAARTYYLWQLAHESDLSWIGFNLFATTLAECHLRLILACAPFLRAFFRRFLPDRSEGNRRRISFFDTSHSNPLSNLSASFRNKRRMSRRNTAEFGPADEDEETLHVTVLEEDGKRISSGTTPATSGRWVNFSVNHTAPLSTAEEEGRKYPKR